MTPESCSKAVLVSASVIVKAQTRQIEAEFKRSRPEPRNRAMGFLVNPRQRRRMTDEQYAEYLRLKDQMWMSLSE